MLLTAIETSYIEPLLNFCCINIRVHTSIRILPVILPVFSHLFQLSVEVLTAPCTLPVFYLYFLTLWSQLGKSYVFYLFTCIFSPFSAICVSPHCSMHFTCSFTCIFSPFSAVCGSPHCSPQTCVSCLRVSPLSDPAHTPAFSEDNQTKARELDCLNWAQCQLAKTLTTLRNWLQSYCSYGWFINSSHSKTLI